VEHGYPLLRQKPSWTMKAPGAILSALGGGAFRHFVPQQIEFFRARDLEVVLTPSGVTLRGKENTTSRAHGLVAEAMTGTSALQSMDPRAQVVEKEIKEVWKVYAARPEDHVGSAILLDRIAEISREIANLPVPYEEWQIVYRQALQLSRAVHGQGQLLEKHISKENPMTTANETRPATGTAPADPESLQNVPLKELLSDITHRVKLLATKEVELAKAEIKSDMKSEIAMAKSLGIAAVCGLLGLNMLLVAAALALATMMPGWAGALIVAAPLIVLGIVMGAVGWAKRVKNPLEVTRASLKEDFEWTKNRLA
jgi:Putative Actinobacterial Holin-X, holin superfamily III